MALRPESRTINSACLRMHSSVALLASWITSQLSAFQALEIAPAEDRSTPATCFQFDDPSWQSQSIAAAVPCPVF